jgi:proteic killer suppression protein
MIRSFKHKGLEKYFTKGTASGIQSAHSKRLRLVLGRLSASAMAQDMDLPGLHLHQLRGKHRGRWSVRVSGNWRITFKFDGHDAIDVDYEDYH